MPSWNCFLFFICFSGIFSTTFGHQFVVNNYHRNPFGLDVSSINGKPDMTDITTIRSLGFMAYNAYSDPDSDQEPPSVGDNFNLSDKFGWKNDSIRGYIYESTDGKIKVISIKGTSLGAFGIGGPTSESDRLNDNIMFSCCCSHAFCNKCFYNGTCSSECIKNAIRQWSDSYYNQALIFVTQFIKQHPWYRRPWIWLTGHSLGGAIAALVATTLRIPSVSFEAPGDALFAFHLGLVPKSGTPEFAKSQESSSVYHIGNTHDPIFFGRCNGYSSSCFLAGYSIQTKCHLGRTCIFPTHGFCSIDKHRMSYMLFDVLSQPQFNQSVPVCGIETCIDVCTP